MSINLTILNALYLPQLLNTLYTELYDTNLFFLKNEKVLKIIDKNKIIKRLEIKKIYPDKLHIKIYEKDPIAIVNKNKPIIIDCSLIIVKSLTFDFIRSLLDIMIRIRLNKPIKAHNPKKP